VAEAAVTPALAAERLHVRHPGMPRDALRDVSMAVHAGEILALVGPNGSGKSTLLSALGRELHPRAGRVALYGRDLREWSRRALARRLARLPQDPASPEGLSVEALAACGRYPHRGAFGPPRAEDREAVAEALAAVALADLRRRPLEALSGGERRRAWLAMVMAQRPEILLLDEPVASLDLRYQWELLALLARRNRERGTTIVLSLHDLAQAASLATRVAVMHRGRLYAAGPPERVLGEEMLRDVFGVESRVVRDAAGLAIRVLGPGDPLRAL
jgi:iron complex transport system ATP-binding protein